MKVDLPLSLPLKGGRTYVHSTDMYPAAIEAVSDRWAPGEMTNVRLVCRELTGSELALTSNPPAPDERVAVFTFRAGGETHRLFFVKRTGTIRREVPYDEDAIAGRGEIDPASERLTFRRSDSIDATLIEVAVACTKALHVGLFPDARGKWVLTQIESRVPLYRLPYEEVGIGLVQGRNLRLTRSEITIDGEPIGHVFFSLT